MRILYITQYFPPEVGAAANRAYESARLLAKDGFHVTVLTAFPNYLLEEIPLQYRKRKRPLHEHRDGIRIIRTYLHFSKNPYSLGMRIMIFFTFMMSSLWEGLCLKDYDMIFATSPPLSLGLTAFVLSRLKGVPYVFEIRDIYPESAVQLRVVKNRCIIGLTRFFARFIYRNADHVVSATEGIRKHLEGEGIQQKISVITTGVDLSVFKPLKSNEKRVAKFNFRNKFNVLFIGIFGRMHALTTVLDAATILKDKPEIQFTFIGEGIQKLSLLNLVRERDLRNVQFFLPQPREIIPQIINACDVCLDSRVKIPLSEGTIPVKVVEYMACGVPVVVGIAGETVDFLSRSQAGLVVEPENAELMAEAIVQLYEDKKRRDQMGRNGRDYVVQHFDRAQRVEKLKAIFFDIHKEGFQKTSTLS